MSRHFNGTVIQSQHSNHEADYTHDRMYMPVLGVIWKVYPADHPLNSSAAKSPHGKGSQAEATVIVVNDGREIRGIIENVVITPPGNSGVDDYYEDLPRPCSLMIDDSVFKNDFSKIDLSKLDGDFAVVSFLGGNISQPYISNWWPHFGNRIDPAT